MTLEVTCKARFAGRRISSRCGEAMRQTGSSKNEMRGIQLSQSIYAADLMLYVIPV